MKKLLLFLPLLFFFAPETKAQTNAQTVFVTTAPSGSCTARANLRYRVPSGVLYTCQSGTWAAATTTGAPGTVTSVSGTTSEIDVATGTTTPVISLNATAINDTIAYCADAGMSDTYACPTPVSIAYVTGTRYRFKANTANTGAATINFNSLGAKTIVKVAGGITTALADNDIRVGQVVDLVYDGTNMQMQSTLGNAAAGASPAGSLGCVQLYAMSMTLGCDLNVTVDSVAHRLWVGGIQSAISTEMAADSIPLVILGESSYSALLNVGISTAGFAAADYHYSFKAAAGDQRVDGPGAATAGTIYQLSQEVVEYNITTDRTSLDWYRTLGAYAPIGSNSFGDLALGFTTQDYTNPLTQESGAIFIAGYADTGHTPSATTGNVGIGSSFTTLSQPTSKLQVDGDIRGTDYKSSDGSAGTTGNGFKNGLCVTASGACPGGAVAPNTPASFSTYSTTTNCADSAGAAACGSAAAGRFVADAAATSVVVSTTAVTANSEVFIEYDSSLSAALSVTCNATIPSAYAVTARTAGTSFTLTTTANIANPGCFSYHVVN